jgi:hypothetical protein
MSPPADHPLELLARHPRVLAIADQTGSTRAGVDPDGDLGHLDGEHPGQPSHRVVILAEDDAAPVQPTAADEAVVDDRVLGIALLVGLPGRDQPLENFAFLRDQASREFGCGRWLGLTAGFILILVIALDRPEQPLGRQPPGLDRAAEAPEEHRLQEAGALQPPGEDLDELLGEVIGLLQVRAQLDGLGVILAVESDLDWLEIELAALLARRLQEEPQRASNSS